MKVGFLTLCEVKAHGCALVDLLWLVDERKYMYIGCAKIIHHRSDVIVLLVLLMLDDGASETQRTEKALDDSFV